MKYQNLTEFLPYFAEGQNLGEWRGGTYAVRRL